MSVGVWCSELNRAALQCYLKEGKYNIYIKREKVRERVGECERESGRDGGRESERESREG